jgi:hypothetical protein
MVGTSELPLLIKVNFPKYLEEANEKSKHGWTELVAEMLGQTEMTPMDRMCIPFYKENNRKIPKRFLYGPGWALRPSSRSIRALISANEAFKLV